jgi:ubiquinone/menaquinone biosynthesis C-methylase UbiE
MSTTTTQSPAKFWDRIADKYSKSPIADEAAYQKKLEVTRGYLRPDMNVLELGCGTGSTAIVHAPHVSHIRAIDVSSKMIEIARGKADAQHIENISFEQSTIDGLDVPDETFDAVLGLSILHLLANWQEVVAKVYKMVKPGGIFVTSTPCLGSSLRYAPLRLILPIGRLFGRVPLVKFFTQKNLEDTLTGAGFAIDYQWVPGPGKAVFIIAKRAE